MVPIISISCSPGVTSRNSSATCASFATSRKITRNFCRNSSGSRRWTCPSPDVLAKEGFGSREFAREPEMGTRTPIKRGDRGRRRTVGRIERGGGNGGEPVRSPPGRYWNGRPKPGSNFLTPSVRSGAPSVTLDCWRHLVARLSGQCDPRSATQRNRNTTR